MWKAVHVFCAYATGIGFALRGLLSIRQSELLGNRLIKTAPHVIDSLLLGSALVMVISWSWSPLEHTWLMAKIVVLLIYIGFGFAMLRYGTTPARRLLGFVGGLVSYAYIVSVAHSKNALGWLVVFSG